MNKFLFFLICCTGLHAQQTQQIAVQATACAAISLLVVSLNNKNFLQKEFMGTLIHDFEFTNQFSVATLAMAVEPSAVFVRKKGEEGFVFVLFIKESFDACEWWLYDAFSATKIAGKRYMNKGDCERGWAHQVADSVWEIMTSVPGFFSTKITYCKEKKVKHGISLKTLCAADYDGSHEEVLVDKSSVIFAPRWNHDPLRPLIFYSEDTSTNVRLMMVDMKGRIRVASNRDGHTMLPSFSADGSKVVYCATDEEGFSQLYLYQDKKLTQLTAYQGNSVGPSLTHDGNRVYFYSDFKSKAPQIFSLDLVTGDADPEQITHGGYNTSPAYCSYTNQLLYTRMVGDQMQVFVCDVATKKHRQLTSGPGNKESCSWSVGGDYILLSVNNKITQQLALCSVVSGELRYISGCNTRCSSPCWSGIYKNFPILID
jgi:tol-pal system beta propeller repeat protein TolB